MNNEKVLIENIENSFFKKKLIKRCPNTPLLKTPYITIKLQCKNLNQIEDFYYFNLKERKKSLDYRNEANQNFNEQSSRKLFISNPGIYLEVMLISQGKAIASKVICHENPKWNEEFVFTVNNKDLILIKINKIKPNKEPLIETLGFQLISIYELEYKKKLEGSFAFEIQKQNFEDYTKVKDLTKYSLFESKIGDKDYDGLNPSLFIHYKYYTFGKLWKMTAVIHSIVQREIDKNGNIIKNDYSKEEEELIKPTGKCIYQYKIYCKRNDGLNWFKEVSFRDIEIFRKIIISELPELKHIPFPIESIFSKIPLIKRLYSDDNDDVLIEKKFYLDNFFDNLLEIEEAYKLDKFNDFFASDS